jgi:hypothetical protein
METYPMTDSAKSLDEIFGECIQEGGVAVSGGRDLYMEVKDTSTDRVWMSAAPVRAEDFETLELDETLTKVGCARASMDRAAFQYSPGAPGESVLERVIQGRLYINVAVPMEYSAPTRPGGPMEILVNKAHLVGFEAGALWRF